MITDLILLGLAILILLISSIYDIKTREVPDNLSIGLIIAALVIRAAYSIITGEWNYLLFGLLALGIMFVIGLILYHTKQWGGADAKILMGLGVVFATQPYFSQLEFPFLLLLFINIILIGGIYGLIFGLIVFFKNKKNAIKEFKKRTNKKLRRFILITTIILILISFFFTNLYAKTFFITMAFFIITYFYLTIFTKTIEKLSFIKQLPLKKVTEGDWLARDVKQNNKLLVSKKHACLTQKDLNLLKRNKITKVWIKIGIPFLPAMTIATVITILISLKGF
jgi:Flp pilus assembly protein protease CpaA